MPTLHDYQKQAIGFLQARKRAGLFLDMGLGKTAISLSALTPDSLPALVTAPKRVAENVWSTEAAIWRPDLTVAVAAGTPAARKKALESGADVVVIGRDNLADAVPYAKRYKTFIMDELSSFKNRGSARWKAAKKITAAPSITHVWGLTGTPAPNGLLDLWPQVFLLDGGERLGKTLGGYRERYFTAANRLPSGIVTEWRINPGADTRIHALLDDLCLSMNALGKLDLPPVTHNMIEVPLTAPARRLYKAMKNELVANLEILGGEIHSAANAAVVTSKLSQITAGFLYVDDADLRNGDYDIIHREKAQAVQEIIDGTGGTGGVLVSYRFKAELAMLQAQLGRQAHTLDEPGVIEKWNRREIPVLLAHPASAGMGINLQKGGSVMIWTSPTWNLEEYLQMNARLARQGQEEPVIIHHLVSPFTVDTAMHERLSMKKEVQAALLDHMDSPL